MRQDIKTKILLRITFIVIASLILVSLFSYLYFGNILENQAIRDNRIQMQQTVQQVDYILKDIQQYSYNMIIDPEIEEFTRKNEFRDTRDEVMSCEKMISKLRKYISLRDCIQSIILKTPKGVYSTDALFDQYYKKLFDESWYKDCRKDGAPFVFSAPHVIKGSIVGGYEVISFIIHFKGLKTENDLNSELIINIYYKHLESILDNAGCFFNEYIMLNNGVPVYLPQNYTDRPNHINELIEESKDSGNADKEAIKINGGYLSVMKSEIDNWTFAVFISKKLLFQKTRNVFVYDFLYIVMVLILTIVVLTPVITNIIKPVKKLSKAAEEVSKGNLNVSLAIKTGDEIELLGNVFNNMTEKLKDHIEESIQNEKQKLKMEQDLLISQINPHFIYNTLNTVTYLARKEKSSDIINVVGSLIKILQDSLKLGKREIFDTVEQEFDMINQYVLIQKYRYREAFQIAWEVADEMKTCVIPKSIIQPLVENALFHGILPEDRADGIINIKIYSYDGNTIIKVSDNGVGMGEELVSKLNGMDCPGVTNNTLCKEGRHIGINNVKERIGNLYGADSIVWIESRKGEGTCVTVKFKST